MSNRTIKKVFLIFILIAVVCLGSIGCSSVFNDNYPTCEETFWGEETYAELFTGISDEDRETLQPIVDLIEQAFCYVSPLEKDKKKFGALSYYCIDDESCVRETHEFKVISAKLDKSTGTGYLWINYTQDGFDKKGKLVQGSGYVNSRIQLALKNGEWIAEDTCEAP